MGCRYERQASKGRKRRKTFIRVVSSSNACSNLATERGGRRYIMLASDDSVRVQKVCHELNGEAPFADPRLGP